MSREITLPRSVRLFEKLSNTNVLFRNERFIGRGCTIDIGDPIEMVYDHREQVAVPLIEKGKVTEIYLIISEIGLPELVN